jgi:hypothetical protein
MWMSVDPKARDFRLVLLRQLHLSYASPLKKMTEDDAYKIGGAREEARSLLAAIAEAYGPVRGDLLSPDERKLYRQILLVHAEALRLLENFETVPLCELETALASVRDLSRDLVQGDFGPDVGRGI